MSESAGSQIIRMWLELYSTVACKAVLQVEALEIFSVCVNNSIRLEPEWIPREQNELADYYSRIVDHDDYMLNLSVFAWLDELWGPHSVDRFASPNNAQLDRLIPDSGLLGQKLWTHLRVTGAPTTTG